MGELHLLEGENNDKGDDVISMMIWGARFFLVFLLEGARGLKSIVSPCISTTADIQIVKYLRIHFWYIYTEKRERLKKKPLNDLETCHQR